MQWERRWDKDLESDWRHKAQEENRNIKSAVENKFKGMRLIFISLCTELNII